MGLPPFSSLLSENVLFDLRADRQHTTTVSRTQCSGPVFNVLFSQPRSGVSFCPPQRKFPNRGLQMIFAAWFRLIKALLRDWLPHSEMTSRGWHFRTEGCQCS